MCDSDFVLQALESMAKCLKYVILSGLKIILQNRRAWRKNCRPLLRKELGAFVTHSQMVRLPDQVEDMQTSLLSSLELLTQE